MSYSTGLHIAAGSNCGQVMRSRIALNRRIGGDDEFRDLAASETLLQRGKSKLGRPYSIQRRQVAHKHKVMTPITGCVLDCHDIGW